MAPQGPSAAVAVEDVDVLGVLSFCDWAQRGAVACLNRSWRSGLGLPTGPTSFQDGVCDRPGALPPFQGEGYWRFLCKRLAREEFIHVPDSLDEDGAHRPPSGIASSWRTLFLELYSQSEQCEQEVFQIEVATRFRPSQPNEEDEEARGVVLPLHQKVQLVRQKLGCSSREAVRLIMSERRGGGGGGGGLFQVCSSSDKENQPSAKPEAGEAPGKDSEEGSEDEAFELEDNEAGDDALPGMDARCSILSIREETASVLAVTPQSGLREFAFNRAFNEGAQQADVYKLTARRLVMEFLNGKSGSVICYGQTASGKTHTMFGPHKACAPEQRGIVPRACSEVLAALQSWRARGLSVELGVSYVELFGTEVSDLLREGQIVGQGVEGRYSAVRATDRVGHRYVLDGHTQWMVESEQDIELLLRTGDEAKRRAATAMNERSTRAHTIFMLTLSVQGEGRRGALARSSRFFFADLGGSEQLGKSKANEGTQAPVTMQGGEEMMRLRWREYYALRQRIQESLNINKGLFSLKRVIEALHRRSRLAAEGTPASQLPYVPYQDSKLTMLLQEALGGASRTVVVATATTDRKHAVESLQTLRFAETCAEVRKRRGADGATSVTAALGQLAGEIAQVQREIARKERWETRLVRRQDVDTVAGAFGEDEAKVSRVEVVPTSVPVGAEEERERLELLLQRQEELQGLSSIGGKDYRSMGPSAAADGGKGVDFRERDRFGAKTKAKDFEDEAVLADALRFLFRKAGGAVAAFGETEWSAKRRLRRDQIPAGYFQVATALRKAWEEKLAAGAESRMFGKAMLDRCKEWSALCKADPGSRDEALCALLHEVNYQAVDVTAVA